MDSVYILITFIINIGLGSAHSTYRNYSRDGYTGKVPTLQY